MLVVLICEEIEPFLYSWYDCLVDILMTLSCCESKSFHRRLPESMAAHPLWQPFIR